MSQVDIKYAREIAQYVIEYYTDHDLDAVYLVYNEFKSVVQQNVVVEPLLPIGRLEVSGEDQNELDYIYEQNPNPFGHEQDTQRLLLFHSPLKQN